MQETPDMTNPDLDAGGAGEPGSADLEQRLQQAEQAARENHDAYLRAKAECDNFRKRSQTEIANAHKYAVESFASELIAVKDSLEAALASESATAENMRAGVELTLKQLRSAFEKFNVRDIEPVGEKFDPHFHQAISMVEAPAEPNTVVQVLQKGYLLHERVIRPALVIVSKGKAVEN
jgi:molecular chaperone GrpE